jgi:hypothetical protein
MNYIFLDDLSIISAATSVENLEVAALGYREKYFPT